MFRKNATRKMQLHRGHTGSGSSLGHELGGVEGQERDLIKAWVEGESEPGQVWDGLLGEQAQASTRHSLPGYTVRGLNGTCNSGGGGGTFWLLARPKEPPVSSTPGGQGAQYPSAGSQVARVAEAE